MNYVSHCPAISTEGSTNYLLLKNDTGTYNYYSDSAVVMAKNGGAGLKKSVNFLNPCSLR